MTPPRLQDQDFTYWFLKEAFGWSVVLQLAWTFDTAPSTNALERMNRALADGSLNRRIVRSKVPLARPRWVRSTLRPTLIVDDDAIDEVDGQDWAAHDLATTHLDAESGTPWRLRGVATTTGGYVLSLTCLHLVADGRSLTFAAQAAMSGSLDRADGGTDNGSIALDVVDAATQVIGAVAGVGRAIITGATSGRGGSEGSSATAPRVPARTPVADRAPTATGSWAVVSAATDEWERAAKEHGGTANSLFVAVVAGALWASGYATDGSAVKVGIPMSLRGNGDDRANATGGVSVVLRERPRPATDLTEIRRLCKDAFTALARGRRPAMIHLQRLLQVLPLSVVTSVVMSGESGMPDAMVSNLGTFDDSVLDLGGTRAESVAFRGTAQGVDPARPHRFGEGLQSWLLEADGTTTFAVLAFDEEHVPDAQRLRELLSAELTGWNVPHRFW
ncbi:hypothetical protein GCM10007304_28540 [Rhodococcoides trifolii]|uniref:Condensation domain-containing protein n=1 Tax=Rhodococcoides trifolii TaxID=908250 RepID=A0A917D6M0_9NOCA|nr:hypothetical protein [Rhodococcus trifolii]GGG12843.1 hypothetical protein GCM10007304_28540 [Rhodococcus trifolii]